MDAHQQQQSCHSPTPPPSSPSTGVLPPVMSRLSSEQTEVDSQVEFHIPVNHNHNNESGHDYYAVQGQKYIQYRQAIHDKGTFLTPPPDTPLSAGTTLPPIQSVLNDPDRRITQYPTDSRRLSSASSPPSFQSHSRVSLPPIHTLSFPKPTYELNQQYSTYNSSTSYQNYVKYHSPTPSTHSPLYYQGYMSPYSAIPSSAPTSGMVSPSRHPIHYYQQPYSAYPVGACAFNNYNRNSGPLVSPPLTAHYPDHHYRRNSAAPYEQARFQAPQRPSSHAASEPYYSHNNTYYSYSAAPSAPSYPYPHPGTDTSGGEPRTTRESNAEYYSRHAYYSNGAPQYRDSLISPRPAANMANHMDRRFTPYVTSPGRSGQSSSRPMSSPTSSSSVSSGHSVRNASSGKGSKTFECETCGKVMKRLFDYRSHIKVHMPNLEKSFRCAECPASFLRKHDLNRHVRIHAGKKSFSCERCGKGFARSDALRRHENMDASMRKYRCVSPSDKQEAAAVNHVTKDDGGEQEKLQRSSSLNSSPSSPMISVPGESAAVTTHAPLVSVP